jgi:hypothetical protein
MLLLFKALVVPMPVFDSATCIIAVDDVAQVLVIPVSPLAAFLQWSQTAIRVPTQTLLVVQLMTLCFIITVECRVNHNCYV